jgi:hypothetical protein
MLFKETIAVYSENHTKPIKAVWAKLRIINCYSRWYIQLPLGFKGLTSTTYSPQNFLLFHLENVIILIENDLKFYIKKI